jgi:hypothetical protein
MVALNQGACRAIGRTCAGGTMGLSPGQRISSMLPDEHQQAKGSPAEGSGPALTAPDPAHDDWIYDEPEDAPGPVRSWFEVW